MHHQGGVRQHLQTRLPLGVRVQVRVWRSYPHKHLDVLTSTVVSCPRKENSCHSSSYWHQLARMQAFPGPERRLFPSPYSLLSAVPTCLSFTPSPLSPPPCPRLANTYLETFDWSMDSPNRLQRNVPANYQLILLIACQ